MLLRCCIKNLSIIIMIQVLFISYLCDLFFIFMFIFIVIDHIFSVKQTHLCFYTSLRICPITFVWKRGWRKRKFSLRVLLSFCLIFCQLHTGTAYKRVVYKKESMFSISVWLTNLQSSQLPKAFSPVRILMEQLLFINTFYSMW